MPDSMRPRSTISSRWRARSRAFKEGELRGIEETHNSSFLLGYQVRLDCAEVPKVDHQREPPVVPTVQLSSHLLPSQQPDSTAGAQFFFYNFLFLFPIFFAWGRQRTISHSRAPVFVRILNG